MQLFSFDPADPEGTLSMVSDLDSYFVTFAINSSGVAYGIESGSGYLHQIDLNNASSTIVGGTGLASSFLRGMAFDLQTDELFLAHYDEDGVDIYTGLYKVNPSTAAVCFLGQIGGGNGTHLTGMFMGDDAPAFKPHLQQRDIELC